MPWVSSRQTSTDVGAKEGRIFRGGVWRRGGVGGEGKGCECRREKEGGHTKGGFEHGLSCEGDGMFGLSRRSLHHTACSPREGKIQSLGPGRPPPPCFTAKSRKQRGRAHTGAALLNGLLFLHVESEVFEHFHGVGLAALEASGVEAMSGAPSMPRTAQLHSAEKSSHLILRFLCRTA